MRRNLSRHLGLGCRLFSRIETLDDPKAHGAAFIDGTFARDLAQGDRCLVEDGMEIFVRIADGEILAQAVDYIRKRLVLMGLQGASVFLNRKCGCANNHIFLKAPLCEREEKLVRGHLRFLPRLGSRQPFLHLFCQFLSKPSEVVQIER
ncbi:hypothetical protein [uncultured Agrobacterium sp.]|uniref:hypothetical protein n=1 Tax=uncultured Agrobacterium sp. TaxID=157277 RepID=UPI0025F31695|nr:hypothetical protein [uncultured Agrobacterium sp.]